jgi:protease I
MEYAGGIWLDEPVVADGHISFNRRPPDFPEYMKAHLEELFKK